MTVKELKEAIKQLVSEDRLDEAIKILENWACENYKQHFIELMLSIKSDFESLKIKEIKGIISENDARIIRKPISDRILDVLNEIPDPKSAKPPRPSGIYVPHDASTSGAEPSDDVFYKMEESAAIEKLDLDIDLDNNRPAHAASVPAASVSIPAQAIEAPQTQTQGGILYSIPTKMSLNIEAKCIVRIAFDKKILKQVDEKFEEEKTKNITVSEVMEVELLELGTGKAFDIQSVNSKEQVLVKDDFTEWQFYVKPLKSGSYKLLLKVAIIQRINDKDRRKEMVLDETVTVNTEGGIADDVVFKPAPMTFIPTDVLQNGIKTILFMGSNPPGTSKVQLEVEHSRIATKLNGQFNFPTEKFVSATDIPELIIQYRPNFIHFSGHGKDPETDDLSTHNTEERGIVGFSMPKDYDETGGIVVFDEDMRGMKIIDDDALEYVFQMAVQSLHIPLEVIVFNSCHSESQAKVIGKYVPYVVGTSRAIEDSTAIAFASGFYFGLAQGQNVELAFTTGKMQAVIADKKAKDLIVLYKNGIKMVS